MNRNLQKQIKYKYKYKNMKINLEAILTDMTSLYYRMAAKTKISLGYSFKTLDCVNSLESA